ncbi:uncharacterized protein LOC121389489 isoform X2 [Gigantopelta aegis]|uniref:uncharacterized protein LOC121389489 isoform X2 n=1 Tax=Gigantopelta aegis TaxID=1735272 RepID=UPI001B88A7E8|nr:uncharacterized protein LOC121389489 isoform X2 [Gigantopelta aegis]
MTSTELQTGACILLHWILLQDVVFHSALAVTFCTKAVPVVQSPAKRIHVLRRVPAACSNWDKSWAWLTKVDCGTKYKLDYVTVPPRETVTYRLKQVCCRGDEGCQSGLDPSDEKFLTIILGSTAAAVLILVTIITISLCHKRRQLRCPIICEERSHIYETAEDIDEVGELDQDRNNCIEDGGTRMIESEYEEIRDCKARSKQYEDDPPRYTDIFTDKDKLAQQLGQKLEGDSFERATAPPLVCEDTELVRQGSQNANTDIHEVLSGTARILESENSVQCAAIIEGSAEKSYYNCAVPEVVPCSMQQETVLQSDDSVILGEDSKPQTVDCSNYETLNHPSADEGHEYEKLVDISEADNDVCKSRSTEHSPCEVDTTPQPTLTMNGHIESATC